MLSTNKNVSLFTCIVVFMQVFFLNQTYAAVMDFETPIMPAAIFGTLGQSYTQDGLENTSIDFSDPAAPPTSHIHGADSGGNRVSQLEADAGGALFRAATGNKFSFQSWNLITLDTAITTGGNSILHVVGMRDGAQVASITLTSADAGTTVDFLARDSNFGNVDRVEYWFSPPGRGKDPAQGEGLLDLLAEIDNVNFDLTPVVPDPPTEPPTPPTEPPVEPPTEPPTTPTEPPTEPPVVIPPIIPSPPFQETASMRLENPQVNEGVSGLNGIVSERSCRLSGSPILGTSVVFPDGVDSTILVNGEVYQGPLTDFLENWSNSLQLIWSRSAFANGDEKTDTHGNVTGLWVAGRLNESSKLPSRIPVRIGPVVINPESCTQQVIFKLAIVDVCILTEPGGFIHERTVNLWTENGLDTIYDSPDDNAELASYIVNRTSPMPDSCDEGYIVEIRPSAAQINRDMPVKMKGQQFWPLQ
ncbi:MAG TPA: hypothetical protein DEF07_03240 [Nitrosomonas sp.]|nr:hypothetical protein [Nitrosomonas sp.]